MNIKINSIILLSLVTNIYAQEDIISMNLEDLSKVEVLDRSITLTETNVKDVPSFITIITQKDIQESGARNLDELLEIYVPDVAYMYKVQGNQLGIGGVINDRNNKILLTLNGRDLNIKASDGGAISERAFSMLGDIKKITVISGPGSTIYGPGAIAGVINIETFDAKSFKGFEANVKSGYVERFRSIDMKYATQLSNGVGVFLYGGMDDYDGASDNDAINKVAFDYPDTNIRANKKIPFYTTNINGSYHDEIRRKFHFQLNYNNFVFWSRYTVSGMAIPTSQNLYTYHIPQYLVNTGAANEQWSNLLSYKQTLDTNFDIDYSLSYVRSKVENTNSIDPLNTRGNKKWSEDNINLHILSSYIPNERTKCALGVEYTYNRFGNDTANIITNLPIGTKWHSDMYSIFGELQTKPTVKTTMFLDLRVDKHTYSPVMFSPRLAFIYDINDVDVLKINYNHSVRVPDDADLYYNHEYNGKTSDVESLDRIEMIYTHKINKLQFDFKSSYNQQAVVAYNDVTVPGVTEYIGDLDFYTFEGIFQYTNKNYTFYISHNYTKQLSFSLNDPATSRQNISASDYGYGNDLANWNNNITKLRFNYRFNQKLKFINSLRIFWGMPGAIDMADYNRDTFADAGHAYYRLPVYTDGTRAFEESAYFNSGLEYQFNKRTKLSLHGYNLLGLFDEDLNKRNYFKKTSQYIDEAASFSISLNYKLQ